MNADEQQQSGRVILGIDLGTTNSLVAVCDARGPRVLGDDGPSGGVVPSVVRYRIDGKRHAVVDAVGASASAQAALHPRTTVYSAKRLLGRSLDDVQRDDPGLSYRVVGGPQDTARVQLSDDGGEPVTVSPQEVAAEVLRALKAKAEAELGLACTDAVVTVPAYFDDAQRQATRDAGRLAGLNVVRIVNEPTAAALAYGIGAGTKAKAETIAVFDLGGGTFDVSILRVEPAAGDDTDATPTFFEVLATAGDTHLGGDDVDRMIVGTALGALRDAARAAGIERGGEAWTPSPSETQALRQLAQAVKHRLSDAPSASMDLSADIGGESVRTGLTLTRGEFEGMISPWIARAMASCSRALADAGLGADGIDRVVLVGGSTRIPLVREKVRAFFGAEPYTALDPDRVVALGAAQQAAIMSGASTGALLLDVIPLSLGIETIGGAVAKLIVRNSTVPARATEMFSTSVDGQANISINVLQGEREMAADCRSLATFVLRGIPPMPAGIPQLEVEFLVDANGVLRVSALEKRSGTAASIQVVPNHGLTGDEVDQIERDALTHAREDMSRHRVVDLIVNAKLDLKWIGERIDAVRDDLTADEQARIDALAAEVRGYIAKAETDWSAVDANAFYAAKQALDEASIPMHEKSIARSLREG